MTISRFPAKGPGKFWAGDCSREWEQLTRRARFWSFLSGPLLGVNIFNCRALWVRQISLEKGILPGIEALNLLGLCMATSSHLSWHCCFNFQANTSLVGCRLPGNPSMDLLIASGKLLQVIPFAFLMTNYTIGFFAYIIFPRL